MAEKLPELQPLTEMKPFLSVMHAKAHTSKCEVQWQVKYTVALFFIPSSSDMLVHIHEQIYLIICNHVMHLLSFL